MSCNRIFLAGLCALCCLSLSARKKPLDHSVYDSWERVTDVALTADGAFLSYRIALQQGDGTLVIRRTADGAELRIPRGEGLSIDGKRAYCSIKAPYAATRAAKIKKVKKDKMPQDSLAVMDLGAMTLHKFPRSKRFKTGFDAMPFVAYEIKDAVVVLNPAEGNRADTIKQASAFTFSRDGRLLALVLKKEKKDSLSQNAMLLYAPATRTRTVLDSGKAYYGGAAFDDAGAQLAFLASADSLEDAGRHCALMLWNAASGLRTLLGADYRAKKDWCLTERSAPFFSRSGKRIFAGMGPCKPPKDTTVVEFEKAQLEIWNWDALYTPPMRRKDDPAKKTFQAVIEVAGGQPVLLSDSTEDVLKHYAGGDGDYALLLNDSAYRLSSYWDANNFCDAYLVSLATGERKLLYSKLEGTPQLSPGGKYILWYSYGDLNWHCRNLSTGAEANLTASLGIPFFDEENDRPCPPDPWDRRPQWTEGDASVLICDRYDLWKLQPDGSAAVCLTKGEGRARNLRYRRTNFVDWGLSETDRKLGLVHSPSAREKLWLSTFCETDKTNGLAVLDGLKARVPEGFTAPCSFAAGAIARNGSAAALTKGDFRHPYDLYFCFARRGVGLVQMAAAEQLTHINPAQADYRWGDVQLVHWKAYDGTPLDGLLFLPEDREPDEKLPLMVYFYERNAETMYSYRQPAPSRSIINIPLYVSNGYAVFVPDVVYKVGHPGESAYNCICAGAEAMCAQFPFLDRDRMAIQGQSWGGYQVAYLVTRTDMFRAGGAGAPVGNMTSAYGGIRWESGLARAMQYEHGQSRIGKSLWDEGGRELYIENSPVFHADKVKTPVLIMHNDADGAVPWYQGIEFFCALRRFGSPAWLLQYKNEAHNLMERKNCKDLSERLLQFFDHYLKGTPMPKWMKESVVPVGLEPTTHGL